MRLKHLPTGLDGDASTEDFEGYAYLFFPFNILCNT